MIASNNYSDEVMGSDITAIMESLNEDIKDANNDSFAVIYKVSEIIFGEYSSGYCSSRWILKIFLK